MQHLVCTANHNICLQVFWQPGPLPTWLLARGSLMAWVFFHERIWLVQRTSSTQNLMHLCESVQYAKQIKWCIRCPMPASHVEESLGLCSFLAREESCNAQTGRPYPYHALVLRDTTWRSSQKTAKTHYDSLTDILHLVTYSLPGNQMIHSVLSCNDSPITDATDNNGQLYHSHQSFSSTCQSSASQFHSRSS